MDMRDKILNAAEARIRRVGYAATSFRDIAGDVGVKSASVHYHFPAKEDLAEALMQRYAERQIGALAEATEGVTDPAARAAAMIRLHEEAFVPGERICLCAMFAAESAGLPDRVAAAAEAFFAACRDWLLESFAGDPKAAMKAGAILAALQGGLLVAAAARDPAGLKAAAEGAAALARL